MLCKDAPDALVALGSASIGALAGAIVEAAGRRHWRFYPLPTPWTTCLAEKYDTERRLAARERDLATGNRRLQAILGATGEALAMFDVEGRVAFANRRYEELCGAEPSGDDARVFRHLEHAHEGGHGHGDASTGQY